MGLAILPLATVCDFSFNRDLPEAFNESLLEAPLKLLSRLVIVLFRELNGQLAMAVGFVILIYSFVAPFQVANFIGFCHCGETLTHVLNEYTVEDRVVHCDRLAQPDTAVRTWVVSFALETAHSTEVGSSA
jgi:hypothetical protein